MNPLFESIPQDVGSSFHLAHFRCDDFALDHTWHYHPEYELLWMMRSSGTRLIGDSVVPYRAGELVMVGSGLPHCWHNNPDDTDKPEAVLLQFSRDFLGAGFFDLPEACHVRALLGRAARGLCFPPDAAEAAGAMLLAATRVAGLQRIAGILSTLEMLATAAAAPIASAHYQNAGDMRRQSREHIARVHHHVRHNLAGHISQAEIARSLGMSPPEFSKFFRAATGQTFVSFVNVLRLNEACRLLASTTLSITQVAMDCGYNNLSHFNRQFLLHKGVTPRDFRRGSALLARPVPDTSPDDARWARFSQSPQHDAIPEQTSTQRSG